MVPKINGEFFKRYGSPREITPNLELSAFLKESRILSFEISAA
ncbi:hypothetical protein LEP1GSC048_2361 [Leptospira santarosai serovar Shermani str. 1342KT]|nr:hypothetical protein LEP1GSC048_2361 [Leptospira santarosai serovar Shermani str. 1342KT]